jgi:tetratricopeptide (TPR) repeat protein
VNDPTRILSAQLRIAVLHEQAGRQDEAVAVLREAQASDTEDGESLRNAFLLEGELLNRRGQLEPSIDALNRGLQIFEGDRALLYARALTYERIDRVPEAIIDLQVLVTEDPDDADALNALGYTMADRTEDHEEALGYIQRALELAPEQPAILDSMGWVLYKLGRLEESLDYLQRAFAAQEDAEIAAHIAEVLLALGRDAEAREIWQKGAALDATNRAIQRLRERLGA